MKNKVYLFSILLVGLICFAAGAAVNNAPKLSPKTKQNLMSAMKGEAFAHAKYLVYADHARKSGNEELAVLFEKAANVERMEHFKEEAELAGLAGDDQANLKDAIQGESYEVTTMYPGFAAQATKAGDKAAAALFEEIRKDEMGHRDGFQASLNKLAQKAPSGH